MRADSSLLGGEFEKLESRMEFQG